jgi:oligopeptide transport system substrate-binding protein
VAEGLIPPSCPGYDPALKGPEFNPDLARQLLVESGYDTSRPIDLVLTKGPWGVGPDAVAGIVEELGAIGLKVEPREESDVAAVRNSRNFDLLEGAWYGDYLDPDTFTFGVFHSHLGSFPGMHDCGELDRLFEMARATTDIAARGMLYGTIHHLFQEVCPALVLLHRRDYFIQHTAIEGVQLYPLLPTVRPRC